MKNNQTVIRCRASYLHCFEPYSFARDGSGASYMMTAIFPKTDRKTKQLVDEAIQAAIEQGKRELWNGKVPDNLHIPLKDGDKKDDGSDAFEGNYYIVAKSKKPPVVVDQKVRPLFDRDKIYSGCYVNVSLIFRGYTAGANRGVTCMLGNIQLVAPGPALGGQTRIEDEFKVLDDEEIASYGAGAGENADIPEWERGEKSYG